MMLASVGVDYFAASAIERTQSTIKRRLLLITSLTANLGLLAYFKYTIFFIENLNGAFSLLDTAANITIPDILLPIGISFYTFQSISYTIDVYRRFIPAQRDFLLFANYVVFFPQLIAGPVLRAREVFWQLDKRPRFNTENIAIGIRRILIGLFLKVVFADNIAGFVDNGYALSPATLSAWDVWCLAILFGFQIYFDFSAYSHIAIGSARLMGIKFPENFNFPYIATSPKEFWRRWHISLSSWIRDYLYLPLCGAKVRDESVGGLEVASQKDSTSTGRRIAALITTWAIMGLWHGAAYGFILWGIWHAGLILLYRLWSAVMKTPRVIAVLGGWAITFPLVMLGWIPFRASSLDDAVSMIGRTVMPSGYFDVDAFRSGYLMAAFPRNLSGDYYLIAVSLTIGFLGVAGIIKFILPWLHRRHMVLHFMDTIMVAGMVAGVFVFLRPIRQFIYFQF